MYIFIMFDEDGRQCSMDLFDSEDAALNHFKNTESCNLPSGIWEIENAASFSTDKNNALHWRD